MQQECSSKSAAATVQQECSSKSAAAVQQCRGDVRAHRRATVPGFARRFFTPSLLIALTRAGCLLFATARFATLPLGPAWSSAGTLAGPLTALAGPLTALAGPLTALAGPLTALAGPLTALAGPLTTFETPLATLAGPLASFAGAARLPEASQGTVGAGWMAALMSASSASLAAFLFLAFSLSANRA